MTSTSESPNCELLLTVPNEIEVFEMAEFCLECWNKMNHTRLTKKDVFLSKDLDPLRGLR